MTLVTMYVVFLLTVIRQTVTGADSGRDPTDETWVNPCYTESPEPPVNSTVSNEQRTTKFVTTISGLIDRRAIQLQPNSFTILRGPHRYESCKNEAYLKVYQFGEHVATGKRTFGQDNVQQSGT